MLMLVPLTVTPLVAQTGDISPGHELGQTHRPLEQRAPCSHSTPVQMSERERERGERGRGERDGEVRERER